MKKNTAIIIADTGFSLDALLGVKNILGYYDLVNRRVVMDAAGTRSELESFAGDPGNHGSIVLKSIVAQAPDRPLILIRSHNPDSGLILTSWQDGRPQADGWVEAYIWAVSLAKLHGLNSVANFSFGAVRHAADGTGWDAFQMSRVTGKGKPGHIAVAAAGGGATTAGHASFVVRPGEQVVASAVQNETTTYNFWSATKDRALNDSFVLVVECDGRTFMVQESRHVPVNFWNERKQITFTVPGACRVSLKVTRPGQVKGSEADLRFDCWTVGPGLFENHIDDTHVVEPACFPSVIAVGFKHGRYSAKQEEPDCKPDSLIGGSGFISFNLSRVVARVAEMLDEEPGLDVVQVRERLGKYPVL